MKHTKLWVFAATLVCGACVFTACTVNDDNPVVINPDGDDQPLTPIEPLLKTKWYQLEPYNLLSPLSNGRRTPTGCTATAMAQVMYYHQWPQEATAPIPGYTAQYTLIDDKIKLEDLPATTLKWNLMLPTYSTGSPGTEEQRQAVAELMRYCGQSIVMKYGRQSGADPAFVVAALRRCFGYSKSIRLAMRSDYTLTEWKKLIWNELNQKRPVIMTAYSLEDGHTFVIDGYDCKDKFHVNWGWSGKDDDYYDLDDMNPGNTTSTGAAKSAMIGFILNQVVLLGVEPSTGTEEVYPEVVGGIIQNGDCFVDQNYLVAPIEFVEYGDKSKKFEFALGIRRADGTVEIVLKKESPMALKPGEQETVLFDMRSLKLTDGSYQLFSFYRVAGVEGDNWKQLGGNRDYFAVEVKDSKAKAYSEQKLEITKAYLEGPGNAPLGENTLVLEVENQGDKEISVPIKLMLGKTVDGEFKTYNDDWKTKSILSLQPKEKKTLRYPVSISFKGDLEIRLAFHKGDLLLASSVVTI